MSGAAIRQAITLGFNMRNDDPKVAKPSKELSYRIWWALCSTERLLAVMTGRPTSFIETDCSAPLPLPLEDEACILGSDYLESPAVRMLRRLSTDESGITNLSRSTSSSISPRAIGPSFSELIPPTPAPALPEDISVQPSNALFFLYQTKLYVLNEGVRKNLYSPIVIRHSWAYIQMIISKYQTKLEKWASALPVVFDFTKKQRDQQFSRQRLSLGFSYYSIMLIVNRPCLCRIDRRIPLESAKAREFNISSAAKCVYAAKSLTELMPDEPNPIGLYKVAPWWCLVHYFMQAVTVMLLELSFRAEHWPEKADDILACAQKVVFWLESMSGDDLAAYRAWRLSSEMLQQVAPKIGRTVKDQTRTDMDFTRDLPMQDLPVAPTTYGESHSFNYGPPFSDSTGYSSTMSEVTNWQPSAYTYYDNFLPQNSSSLFSGPYHPNPTFSPSADVSISTAEDGPQQQIYAGQQQPQRGDWGT